MTQYSYMEVMDASRIMQYNNIWEIAGYTKWLKVSSAWKYKSTYIYSYNLHFIFEANSHGIVVVYISITEYLN